MSVVGLRHVRQTVVQEMPQLTKEVGLAADVRGQHHGLDDELAIVEVVGVERRGQSRFMHQCHAGSPVMVLQHGVVVVQAGQVGGGDNEKLLAESGVIQVMADGGNDGGHLFHGLQVIAEDGLIYEAGHGLGDVSRVNAVVIWVGGVVVALHGGKKAPDRQSV